jgi:nitrite reductase (NADH) small subunit
MAVVTFDPSRVNFIESEGQAGWFMAPLSNGCVYVLPSRCPHRGGPLHLGTIDPTGKSLICPWHDNTVSVRWLCTHALPLVKRQGGPWTVIAPDAASGYLAVFRAVRAVQPNLEHSAPDKCNGCTDCGTKIQTNKEKS